MCPQGRWAPRTMHWATKSPNSPTCIDRPPVPRCEKDTAAVAAHALVCYRLVFSPRHLVTWSPQTYLLRQKAQQLSQAQRDASWVFKYLLIYQVRCRSTAQRHCQAKRKNTCRRYWKRLRTAGMTLPIPRAPCLPYGRPGKTVCTRAHKPPRRCGFWRLLVAAWHWACFCLGRGSFKPSAWCVVCVRATTTARAQDLTDIDYLRGWCVEFASTLAVLIATVWRACCRYCRKRSLFGCRYFRFPCRPHIARLGL